MQKSYKANILIVDNDEVNTFGIQKALLNEGFKTTLSMSSMEALAELHKQEFDVVLLDNMIQEITGLELLDIIKYDDKLKDIPFIILGSGSNPEEAAFALEKGAVEYIRKPVDHIELIARIKTTLRIRDHEQNLKRVYKTIEKQSLLIAESIEAAKKIQTAILPSCSVFSKMFSKSFIYYQPRDIVSGDFYWFEKKDDKIFIVEADCTGHGISGAFLSMIGYSLLNEIILYKNITNPVDILRNLNKDFVFSLNKNFENDDRFLFDGMDLTVASIDVKEEEVIIAAAGQDAFILDHSHNLTRLKGDLFSIGYDIRGDLFMDFTEYKMSFEEVKSFFLLSDGLIDQFGGSQHEKYGMLRFENFLKLHSELEMNQIKQSLIKEHEKWKLSNIQTDDILIIGIEI